MQHFRMLLFQNGFPRVFRDIFQLSSDGMMPHLPVRAGKQRIGPWNWTHLEFRVRREGLAGQYLMSLLLLPWKLLPLDVSGMLVRLILYGDAGGEEQGDLTPSILFSLA